MSKGLEPGFGATLAAAREAKGLTRNEVAERLKLSPRQIEALETEDWTALPDPVFVRGFVRNYARLIDLDAKTLISRSAGATATETITAPSAGVRLGGSPVARWLFLPLVLVALFVGGVAALYTWLRQGEDAMLPLDQGMPATDPALAPALEPVTPPASSALPPVDAPAPIEAPLAPPAAATQAPVPVSPAPAAAPPRPSASPPGAAESQASTKLSMRFSTTEDAWIQVVDSQGMRFAKLMRAGTSEVVSGTPPFKLVVGNAAHVSLVYNGQSIDLKPYIGEKVARLTLE